MKIYAIFAEGYSDNVSREILGEHVYLSKNRADSECKKLYDEEIKRRVELLQNAMKVDPSAQWHYERLMREIEDKSYGNLNPLIEVVELNVRE